MILLLGILACPVGSLKAACLGRVAAVRISKDWSV